MSTEPPRALWEPCASACDESAIALNPNCELRQWCLDQAFKTREISGVGHMVVTNVAEEYYRWIMFGESQRNRQIPGDGAES